MLGDGTNEVTLRRIFSPSLVSTKYRCCQHKHLTSCHQRSASLSATAGMSNFSIEHILYGKKSSSSGNEENRSSRAGSFIFSASVLGDHEKDVCTAHKYSSSPEAAAVSRSASEFQL